MNKQRGAFSIGLGVLIGVIVLVVVTAIGSYISAANFGNRTERELVATVDNNQNIYANGTSKVVEIAQVPAMYRDDVSRVTREAIEGRYGPNGSQAVFQMLREQNPQLDAKLYAKIQQAIEAFRNEFQQNQTLMLDKRRAYETALGNVWQGFWLGLAGYPKTDMKQFQIVTTDKAADTFRTKRDTGIQLRPAN